ncbi:MAG: cupin domain-containing protein [Candidatus Wallbacteria bacterium]|nr:cupin domain-containing protein [Candidatus Wallbacteria bacterium]
MNIINRMKYKNFVHDYSSEADSALEIIGKMTCPECKALSLREITLGPGKKIKSHMHPHHEEVYFLLFGLATMMVGEESVEIRRNDAILIPAGTAHSIENTGNNESIILEIGPSCQWAESTTSA